VRPLGVAGAWLAEPTLHGDARGVFLEWYRAETQTAAAGDALHVAQANLSTSSRGTVRGVHFADVPPGQAKYVTCVHGAVLDVVVDLRTGSPTFGEWEAVPLDDTTRHAVYLSVGLGHAFCALSEQATIVYLCSTPYAPAREHSVHPLDPDLGIVWPVEAPILSERDAAAPSLAEAGRAGVLPDWPTCRDYRAPA
jgi:dTDP-4-dehydrorhamnose 3,5-epimerase